MKGKEIFDKVHIILLTSSWWAVSFYPEIGVVIAVIVFTSIALFRIGCWLEENW